MIAIDTERCSGCGRCVEICPTGALYLVDGEAAVDEALCNTCKECLAACPTGAILVAPQVERNRKPVPQPKPLARREPAVIRVKTQPLSWRARVLPVAGAALAWAAREILPQLADLVLDRLDRRTTVQQPTGVRATQVTRTRAASGRPLRAGGGKGGGQRRRHRHKQRQR